MTTDSYKLTRRERERLRQRQEMLTAALELFSSKGYRNVSMHEIAQRAEFAVGTLYKFFKSKEDLYHALIMEQCEQFHLGLTQAIDGPAEETEKLRNFVRAKGQLVRANVAWIRLYLAETQGARLDVIAGLDPLIRARYEEFLRILAGVFERGMKKKRFKRIAAPYHLALALDSVTNALLLRWIEAPDVHPFPENPDVILNILFKGLIEE